MTSELNQGISADDVSGAQGYAKIDDTLLKSVAWICKYYGAHKSESALLAGLPRAARLSPSLALQALQNAGMTGGLVKRHAHELPVQVMPIILTRHESGGCLLLDRVKAKDENGKLFWQYHIILPEISNEAVVMTHEELHQIYAGYAILVKPKAALNPTETDELAPAKGHWFFGTLWRYRSYYRSAAIAAVLVNILALASIFFTMNVYDRVIPNQAFTTLWSLAIGVTVAMVFEAISRYIRAHLIDMAGKKADLVLGSMLFRQALSVRMEHKPASSGAFANQLREFESLREFMASATLAALTDLPFVLLFIGIIFFVSGFMGFIPLLMIPVIITLSVIIQWPLARSMKENLKESSLKQGILIESIEGVEVLKATQGEAWMQRRWQNFSALQSATSMKTRHYSSLATGVVALMQQLQTVILIVAGVYMIDAGALTMGALIATVMLSSRATAPLSQIMGLAVRFQQAKAALTSLNALMKQPVDRDTARDYLPLPQLSGTLQLKDVTFSYPAPPMQPNPQILKGINLSLKPGERIAILGKIGSGKSTLLRVMSQLYQPTGGQLFADGLDVNQIDPADWRKIVAYVGQGSRLFSGTLRDNIMIGCPEASPGSLLRVLQLTGLDAIAARHPAGINLQVGEGGDALSGGQRQLVALARSLLAEARVLLLDEPTSAMDIQTEQQFMRQLNNSLNGQALVIVTHRHSLLQLVDRIVVVDDGRILLDGPKEQVLARLNSPKPQAVNSKAS